MIQRDFSQRLRELDIDHLRLSQGAHTQHEIEGWLANPNAIIGNPNALSALLSPAAEKYIEPLAQLSSSLTRQRFGNTIGLYAPLYVSNLCANDCDYCGFSMSNSIKRKILSEKEIEVEARVLRERGIESVLLVSGEHERKVGIDYFSDILPALKSTFSYLAIEIQPLSEADYAHLVDKGLDAVMVYQETYRASVYALHHIRGKKTNFNWRLDCPDRAARAGVEKIGLGVLLGLTDWRLDALLLGYHLAYLEKRYWRSRFSLSMPRLRPCTGSGIDVQEMSDRAFVQMLCAFRLFSPNSELSLSTRESATLRDHLLRLGVTHMSAQSSTEPGGYSSPNTQLDQFEISDERSVLEVATAIRHAGLQPIWKDWHSEW